MRISDWSSDVCSSDLLSQQVREAQQGLPEAEASALSVMLELQADCLAGLWANRADAAMQLLEPGDIDEALGAASAIGDDALQAQAQRQEESRVGEECGSSCRYWWSPYH